MVKRSHTKKIKTAGESYVHDMKLLQKGMHL